MGHFLKTGSDLIDMTQHHQKSFKQKSILENLRKLLLTKIFFYR